MLLLMSAPILKNTFFKISFKTILKIKISFFEINSREILETSFIKISTTKVNFKEIKFIQINYVNFIKEKEIKEVKVKTRCPSTPISTTAGGWSLRFVFKSCAEKLFSIKPLQMAAETLLVFSACIQKIPRAS